MADSKRIGYAVVGLGHIAQRAVLPGFEHAKKSKLVALVSNDLNKARKLAKQYGAPHAYAYTDYDACLHNPEVQAVFIASVNGAHAAQTVRAAAAGKHVLCEKPMANTVEECLSMIEACKRHKVRLMIAYRKYFEPASLALKELVTKGKLGRLRIIHSSFTFRLRPGKSWHCDKALSGGGSLMDVGVYCVNTIRWLVGKQALEASAYAWSLDKRFAEVDESIAFQLKFPGGIVAQASSSFAADKSSFIHVHGEEGWASLDPAYAYDDVRRLLGRAGGRWFEQEYKVIDEFALELDGLADCIRQNRGPEPDGPSGMEGALDVAVMQAIYQSAQENKPVAVPAIK
jgi:predicted dehydrogenase